VAISSVLVAPPPKDTALLTRDGRISEVWLSWLTSITTTATIVQNLSTLSVIAEDNSTDANTSAILAELTDAITLLLAAQPPPVAPDDLSYAPLGNAQTPVVLVDLLPSLDAPNNAWRAEADELRALIVAGDPASFGFGSFDAAGAAAAAQAASLPSSTVLAATAAAVLHQFLTSYAASTGAFTLAQPAFTDLSGTATAAQTPLAALLAAANTFGAFTQTFGGPLQATTASNSYFTGGGNLGIGNTNPLNLLSVKGSVSNNEIVIFQNTNAVAGTCYGLRILAGTNATDAALNIQNVGNTATLLYVRGDGNVGINNASPLYKLDVNGAARVTSLDITTGTNTKTGSGTLVAGTVTIANTSVTANSKIFLTPTASSATTSGVLAVTTITAATSFIVKSSLATDVATFSYFILETA
jgi:hypothetical protein